jgi:hypothetical protein
MSNTDSTVNVVKEQKKSRINSYIRTEQETGLRFCNRCDKMLPLDRFQTNRRKYVCSVHLKEIHVHETLGTQEKRAFNCLRCRARSDMLLFKQERMFMPKTLVLTMLTAEQIANFPDYCIVPKRPDQPLSKDNSIIVTLTQRKYVIKKWKSARDADKYEHELNHILNKV